MRVNSYEPNRTAREMPLAPRHFTLLYIRVYTTIGQQRMQLCMVDCVETATRVVSIACAFRLRRKARGEGVLVAELINIFRYLKERLLDSSI